MIGRHCLENLLIALSRAPAVALLGPRQVGKTTLAHALASRPGIAAEYLDLEAASDAARLSDPEAYLGSRADRLVILDEVQRVPELFTSLRGIIDARVRAGRRAGQFLLLGSASLDLLQQSSESLAGRIEFVELAPLHSLELDVDDLEAAWLRGGFPPSLLAMSDADSSAWRASFVSTYLERDIPLLGPRIPAETLRRFWTMLAHRQGGVFNASELGRSLGVTGKTIARYLDLMVDLLLVRRLEPLLSNVGKRMVRSPKVYIRDPGLVHSLLRIDTLDDLLGHPIAGASWEGHVLENLLRVAPARSAASFYRTAAGAEIDLVIDLPGNQRWAVEVKLGLTPSIARGVHHALEDVQPDRAFVVYSGRDRYPRSANLEVIGLRELSQELAAA